MPHLLLDSIPESLRTRTQSRWVNIERAASSIPTFWTQLEQHLEQHNIQVDVFWNQLTRVLVASEYVAEILARSPEYLMAWVSSGELFRDFETHDWIKHFTLLDQLSQVQEFDTKLRQLRQSMMIRFIWREIQQNISLEKRLNEISQFADLAIQKTAEFHYQQLMQESGVPKGEESQRPQPLLILAMGKLGANELNLSSDIDLIFTYPESGNTEFFSELQPASGYVKPSITNQEFFTKLGQRLIKSLDAVTAEGFVYRVDMRLRPYGQSGALALNFSAMEDYYQSAGREWERFAMIKARTLCVVTGRHEEKELLTELEKLQAQKKLRQLLQPFTYRQYVDFSAIDSLREMKALIARQVQKKSMQNDIKLGDGGIREIEFVVQAFQLIRGGRDPLLRRRQVMKLLPYLEANHYLPENAGAALLDAYIFLRNLEHLLQAAQDRQTQTLPTQELEQLCLAWTMGFNSWPEFLSALDLQRKAVSREFKAVIAEREEKESINLCALDLCKDIWFSVMGGGELQADSWLQLFAIFQSSERIQTTELKDIQEKMKLLRESHALTHMQSTSRERVDAFVPRLLLEIVTHYAQTDLPISLAEVLSRLTPLVESIARRSAYLLLLLENPIALKHLVKLCAASVMIANQISHYPALLDELLTPETLYAPPNKETLRDELRREFLRINSDDLETQMEALRYFRAAHALRVAASEVTGALPLMKVSDYLSFLAEVILEQVLALSWDYLTARHGFPQSAAGEIKTQPDFVIIAYGKLGGLELSHGSDLDLVFLHNADANLETSGRAAVAGKPGNELVGVIDNLSFYARLGQRIISLLNTNTQFGRLYEVDMRLRPSGNSGLLVSSLAAFIHYQKQSAWTWEHQALVRARPVAGSEVLGQAFEQVRREILCQPRDLKKLREDVRDMRHKMREQLGSSAKGKHENNAQFSLKQDEGGIVDIEFMVQYAALAWANKAPEIIQYTDNIRILGSLETAGLLDAESTAQLIAAYKAYRSTGHRLALQQQDAVLTGDHHFVTEREQIKNLWQKLIESDAS